MKKLLLSFILAFTSTIAVMANGHTVTVSATYSACYGEPNGMATVRVSGGTGPFTYSWAPTGGTDSTAADLSASITYTVTVTDQNDLSTATTLVNVSENPQIVCVTTSYPATCGNADGGATVSASGGSGSISSWNWEPGGLPYSAPYLSAGTYTVTVTDASGCTASADVTVDTQIPVIEICMVTTDSLSKNNIVMWDKTFLMGVDSFIVYRAITANNYQPIGVVLYDSLSQFVDTVRTRYFPNTGDPNTGSYRYKLQAHTPCGDYGPLSPYHNTIHITNNGGTFSWPEFYTIENGASPVASYNLMRDDFSTGNWQKISSVDDTVKTVSDPQYTTYQNTARWRIETQFSFSCTPTRSFSTSLSNAYTNAIVTIKEIPGSDNALNVYPNPFNDNTTFTILSDKPNEIYSFELIDILGKQVKSMKGISVKEFQISRNGLPNGIYRYKIYTAESIVGEGKLVIQ
ncbi:MAG: T9SS type A sorting domain-containing protein [Bacteroidota bacterium]